jgi:surface polysaccharide O-acyltransferase-like enzyme
MNRNYSIDTLRTIATLLVILLHISAGYVITGKNDLVFDTSFWIGNIVDSFSRICVPLFVLMSGMFLVGRNESFKQSYQKRASRILIPLISWTIIYIVYRVAIPFITDNPIDIKTLLVTVISGRPYYHMWYLFMIIGLYLITPILNNSISYVSRNTLWTVAILLLLFGMLNSGYDKILNNKVSFILWFINYLGYFILGYLIKDSKRSFSFLALSSAYIISSILIAVLSLYTIKQYNSLYFYGYLTPFVIIGSLSFYKFFHQLKLGRNVFSKISHLTLGIYLIHAGVLHVLNLGLSMLDINIFNNSIIGIPMKFCITFFISLIAAWIISKVKYIRNII